MNRVKSNIHGELISEQTIIEQIIIFLYKITSMNILFSNQRDNYPIILIPNNYFSYINNEIDKHAVEISLTNLMPKNTFSLRAPNNPKMYEEVWVNKKYKEFSKSVFIFGIFISGFISFILASVLWNKDYSSLQNYLAFAILPFILISIWFYYQSLINREQNFIKQEYFSDDKQKALKLKHDIEYNEWLRKKNNAEIDYNDKLLMYLHSIESLRRNEINKYIDNLLVPQYNPVSLMGNYKIGASEKYFLNRLKNVCQLTPKTNMGIDSLGNKSFSPDILLICHETGIHIDIEIDEPYTLEDGIPIHHTESDDSLRDDYFLSINYSVIRFSESQIIENCDQCIETIKSVYHAILNRKSHFQSNIGTLPKWTEGEALNMAQLKYREKLLKIISQPM